MELGLSKSPSLSHEGNACVPLCAVVVCWVERSERQSTQLICFASDPPGKGNFYGSVLYLLNTNVCAYCEGQTKTMNTAYFEVRTTSYSAVQW